jgi:hypothetical protein
MLTQHNTHLCDACGGCDVHNDPSRLQLLHVECLRATALQVWKAQGAISSVAQQPGVEGVCGGGGGGGGGGGSGGERVGLLVRVMGVLMCERC